MATMHRDAGTHSTSFSQEAGGGQQIIDELDDAIEPNEFGANQEVVVDGSDGSSARPSPNEELTLSEVVQEVQAESSVSSPSQNEEPNHSDVEVQAGSINERASLEEVLATNYVLASY